LSSLSPFQTSKRSRSPTRFAEREVKSACGMAARLAPHRTGVYGDIEREGAMSWTKPAFEEIKMDAEAKSYSDGITW
jgi:hypothetical protein